METQKNLYEDWVVYQIYPKSFCDSNGDGIGDMQGIISKLPYIKELGANAVWICPMYKSPQGDNGYDVADYRDFHPTYGTMRDFEKLVSRAHALGIKVIMDLVANHTSEEHEWFQKARKNRNDRYHGYYVWAKTPPNTWRSVFGGSAWKYNATTKEYYLHSFAECQPDLRWENPKVRKEFCAIVDFWLDKGVDGFRCDVLDFIAKDFKKDKMFGAPALTEYLQELFSREKASAAFTVGEFQTDEKRLKEICGSGALKCTFQMEHIEPKGDKFTSPARTMAEVAEILKKWQGFTQKNGLLCTLLTDNHDYPWLNSRVGNDKNRRYESATALATMVFLLRGIPFIYQGQEIGAANARFDDIAAFDDVETHNYYKKRKDTLKKRELMARINRGSRDNARRPMAWSKEKGFGFTTGTPWLPFSPRSGKINAEKDLQSKKSVLRYYRELFALRKKYAAFRRGEWKDATAGKGYFAYERSYGKERFLIVCNFGKRNGIDLPAQGELVLTNMKNGRGRYATKSVYAPYEVRVYKTEKEKN